LELSLKGCGNGDLGTSSLLLSSSRIQYRTWLDELQHLDERDLELVERSLDLMSQFAISKGSHGGRRKLPLAFTEQGAITGVATLSFSIQWLWKLSTRTSQLQEKSHVAITFTQALHCLNLALCVTPVLMPDA